MEICGRQLTEEQIVAFERELNVILPHSVRETLVSKANGGFPRNLGFTVNGLEAEPTICFHGLLGIDHSNPNYDLKVDLLLAQQRDVLPHYFPIGFDDLNGMLLVQVETGTVFYKPWDKVDEPTAGAVHIVASSLADFFRNLTDAPVSSTPEGYVWHFHQTPGRMQLVPRDIFNRTGHPGGYSIWGRQHSRAKAVEEAQRQAERGTH